MLKKKSSSKSNLPNLKRKNSSFSSLKRSRALYSCEKSESPMLDIVKRRSKIAHNRNSSDSANDTRTPTAHKRTSSFDPLLTSEEGQSLSLSISSHYSKKNTPLKTTIEYYKVGKLIGKGSFGKVVLAVHKLTGKNVAIKSIDKSFLQSEENKTKVKQEIYFLKKLHNPYIVRILEVFEAPKHLLIVMEYMSGGDMFQYIKFKGRLVEEEARPIVWQILTGTLNIHRNGIAHRDFKLDNILLDSKFRQVKICDFGVSKQTKPGKLLRDSCGTPAYLAPEIIVERGYDGFLADIWSLGVLIYILVTGTIPFKANNLPELHKAILKGEFSLPKYLSTEAKDLISNMLKLVPSERISIENALMHPWFAGFQLVRQEENDIDNFVLSKVEGFGFPRDFVLRSLRNKDLNHATATYRLIYNSIY